MTVRSKSIRARGCVTATGLMAALATVPVQAAEGLGSFGSPDQFASQKASFDIVGMKLGAPVDEAIKALKAYDPKIQISPQSGTFQLMPDMKITPAYVADELLASNGSLDRYHTAPERFLILATTAPGKPYVWGISRTIEYPVIAKRPLATSFVSSLKEKYGTPTFSSDTNGAGTFSWYIDKDGNPYPMPKGTGCISNVNLDVDQVAPQSFNTFSGYISMGRVASLLPGNPQAIANADASPACGYAAKLEISTNADGQGRLTLVQIQAENFKLGWAGMEVTRQALIAAQNAQEQKEKDKASHQSGPQL